MAQLSNPLYSNMTTESIIEIIKTRRPKLNIFNLTPNPLTGQNFKHCILKVGSKFTKDEIMTLKTYSHAMWELSERDWWYDHNWNGMEWVKDFISNEVKDFKDVFVLPFDEGNTGWELVALYVFKGNKVVNVLSFKNY